MLICKCHLHLLLMTFNADRYKTRIDNVPEQCHWVAVSLGNAGQSLTFVPNPWPCHAQAARLLTCQSCAAAASCSAWWRPG